MTATKPVTSENSVLLQGLSENYSVCFSPAAFPELFVLRQAHQWLLTIVMTKLSLDEPSKYGVQQECQILYKLLEHQ